MKKIVIILLGIFLALSNAFAQDNNRFVSDLGNTIGLFFDNLKSNSIHNSAEQGDAEAQFLLFQLYDGANERLVAKDEKKALYWLKKSAKQNYAPAQNDLGAYYDSVKKDGAKALHCFREAAKQLNHTAMANIGSHYFEKNQYHKAFYNYHRSAIYGNSCAQFALGQMYAQGIAVKKDSQLAHDWFEASAKSAFLETSWHIKPSELRLVVQQYADYESAKLAHKKLPALDDDWLLKFDKYDEFNVESCMSSDSIQSSLP